MQMCFIFYFYLFLTVSQKKWLGEWTLWHALLYFAKINWLYVRTIGVCGYGYIHGYMCRLGPPGSATDSRNIMHTNNPYGLNF